MRNFNEIARMVSPHTGGGQSDLRDGGLGQGCDTVRIIRECSDLSAGDLLDSLKEQYDKVEAYGKRTRAS
jgi:hypothetical protein